MLLAFDTSMAACSAAVYDLAQGGVRAFRFARMERGHADALAPMIKEVMDETGIGFSDLQRIGVTLGPGTFTGVRTGIAMARGLALALDRPIAGIETLSAIAANARTGKTPLVIAADARRDEIYFALAGSSHPPLVLPIAEAIRRLPTGKSFILGTGAEALIAAAPSGRLVRLPSARSFPLRAFRPSRSICGLPMPSRKLSRHARHQLRRCARPRSAKRLYSLVSIQNVLTMHGRRRNLPS